MGGWVERTASPSLSRSSSSSSRMREASEFWSTKASWLSGTWRMSLVEEVGGWVGGLGRGDQGGSNELLLWAMERWVGGLVCCALT